jgi:hypothetical protein
MTLRTGLVAVAGFAAAVIMIFTLTPVGKASKTERSRHAEDVAELRAEIAELKQGLTVANGALVAAAAKNLPQPQIARADPKSEVVVEPQVEKYEPTDVEVRAKLDGYFDNQRPDPAWSKQATVLLDNHIYKGIPSGSKLLSVECRSSICRVESTHASTAVYQKFVDEALLFHQGGWDGPIMTQITNPGVEPVVSVAYLLRNGEDMEKIVAQ